MARGIGRMTARVVIGSLMALSVAVADEAVAAVTTWGTEDQTAVVGRLFELHLPGVDNGTSVRVRHTLASPV